MWKDEIVEETRQARDAYAASFNYDLMAICRDLKARELEEKRLVVSFPPKLPGRFSGTLFNCQLSAKTQRVGGWESTGKIIRFRSPYPTTSWR